MAALIASKRAPLSKLMEKLLISPARSIVASSQPSVRSLNTNAQFRESDEDERSIDVDRRSGDRAVSRRRRRGGDDDFPAFFSEAFDPFNPTRSLSQVLNLMDQMLENPFQSPARATAGGVRRGWDAREDKDALYLRIDMPGLGKEHVRVSAEQNTLIIRGEGEKDSEEEGENGRRRYSSRIELPQELYKMEEIKAEMKNGVLKIVVPKVKEEERRDVFQVQID